MHLLNASLSVSTALIEWETRGIEYPPQLEEAWREQTFAIEECRTLSRIAAPQTQVNAGERQAQELPINGNGVTQATAERQQAGYKSAGAASSIESAGFSICSAHQTPQPDCPRCNVKIAAPQNTGGVDSENAGRPAAGVAPSTESAVRYERVPSLDKRIARGDDYAGDAYVRWLAVGHHPNEIAGAGSGGRHQSAPGSHEPPAAGHCQPPATTKGASDDR